MRDEYQEHWLREHRWKVAGTTVAVFGVITMGVVRWARDKEKEEAIERVQVFEETLRNLPPPAPVMPEDPPPPPAAPPLRFEVTAGGQVAGVADGAAEMNAGGAEISVREWPRCEFAGGGVSFRHPCEVSVTVERDGSVVAAIDGASVVLVPLARDQEIAPGFPGTGGDDSQPGKVLVPIAGGEREGTLHHRSSGAIVSTFAVDIGKRRLGIILYRDGAGRPIAALEEVLASLEASPETRGPRFEVLFDGGRRKRVVPVAAPVVYGKGRDDRVVVRRRPTIRRTIGDLTFEHPWGLAISPGGSEVASVAVLRGRQVAIRLVALPMAMGVGAARSSLLGSAEVRDDGPVEVTFDGDEVRGKRYLVTADIGDVRAELFVLRRGGKHIGAAVIYVDAEQGEAFALAEPVLRSVR